MGKTGVLQRTNAGLKGMLSCTGKLTGKLSSTSGLHGRLSDTGELQALLDRSFWTLRVEHVDELPTANIDPHVVYVVGG